MSKPIKGDTILYRGTTRDFRTASRLRELVMKKIGVPFDGFNPGELFVQCVKWVADDGCELSDAKPLSGDTQYDVTVFLMFGVDGFRDAYVLPQKPGDPGRVTRYHLYESIDHGLPRWLRRVEDAE